MLQGHDASTPEGLDKLVEIVMQHSTAVLDSQHLAEYVEYMNAKSVVDMKLDDSKFIG